MESHSPPLYWISKKTIRLNTTSERILFLSHLGELQVFNCAGTSQIEATAYLI